MIIIGDKKLTAQIDPLGAQLHSLKLGSQEYLWQGDPSAWKRQAPVLFPFVGRLKDDQFMYQDRIYHLTQHGFARDQMFSVVQHNTHQVIFELRDSEQTRRVFPFSFILDITYTIQNGKLNVEYQVSNPSHEGTLIYAIGAHPGFNVPLEDGHQFSSMMVQFSPAKAYSRINLVAPGPYSDLNHPQRIDFTQPLNLSHDLFKNDAIVVNTNNAPVNVTVTDSEGKHGVEVDTFNNKFIGLWSPYPAQAQLLCIEPWWGIADSVDSDGQLIHKAAMSRLAPEQEEMYQFAIKPF